MVDALYSNATPDILIIPVGISYDRIIEGHYNSEQLVKVFGMLLSAQQIFRSLSVVTILVIKMCPLWSENRALET